MSRYLLCIPIISLKNILKVTCGLGQERIPGKEKKKRRKEKGRVI